MQLEDVNKKIEEARERKKFYKHLLLMFETGMLNKPYFERMIEQTVNENNAWVDVYNSMIKGS